MSTKTTKQVNQSIPWGDQRCWSYIVHEGVALSVTAQAESGATEIRLDAPDGTVPAFADGDVVDIEISPGNYHRIEVTADADEGHDAGQAYSTVSIQTVGQTTLTRRIPKGTVAYVASNISSRVFTARLFTVGSTPVAGLPQDFGNADINKDDGTAAKRGKIEVTVSDAISSNLAVDAVLNGLQVDKWVEKVLPKIPLGSDDPYTLRIELDEVLSGGNSVQFSIGIVVVLLAGN
jgi:hypothetical protein